MGNKSGKKISKTPEQELSDEEIELLLANTDMDRFKILEWHEGFLKVYFFYTKMLNVGQISLIHRFVGSLILTRRLLKFFYILKDCPSGKLDKAKFTSVFQQLYPDGK
jgi:hypothetical protein